MRRSRVATTTAVQKRVFWALVSALAVLFALYGYFVSMSITNVLLREEVEQQIAEFSSEISQLEFAYLDHKNSINLQYAYDQGFSDISNKTFVTRKSVLGERLTLNNEI